jgi:uncharacterized membrane protein
MRRNREMRTRRAQGWVAALWVWPTVFGALALLLGTVLMRVDVGGSWLASIAWPGDSDAASTMVQIVAGSVITVTSLTFSLTVVALQLASQQFSPRLLREFARDPFTKASLCVLVGTFVLSLTVLREIRADTPPPHLAVLAVFVMGLASLAAVLFFITHLIRILRIDTMMLMVHGQTTQAIGGSIRRTAIPGRSSPDRRARRAGAAAWSGPPAVASSGSSTSRPWWQEPVTRTPSWTS